MKLPGVAAHGAAQCPLAHGVRQNIEPDVPLRQALRHVVRRAGKEAHDMAMVAHASTLEAKVPFMHFFDGFRTSHEVQKIEEIPTDVIREMIDDKYVEDFRKRALDPEHPTMRGTAQNPDINFQGRESCEKYYQATPAIVQKYMDKLAKLTGRAYKLYDYVGAPDAEYVAIAMGSGCDTLHETVDALVKEGKKVGLVKVHLYRPFSMKDFVQAIPETVKVITVLDRTKEPGAIGDPLYLDACAAIGQASPWMHPSTTWRPSSTERPS